MKKGLGDKRISIIMPAYNEQERILPGIEETMRTFDAFGCEYELIVVDDGSKDNTFALVKEFGGRFPKEKFSVIRNRTNYGKGRALKKGFRHARGDFIVFLDADMDLHPGQIDTFFDIMELTESDIVIGSKRHPNSQLFYPRDRMLMSTVYFFLVKLFFGLPINDTQTGLKLFKREVLKKAFPAVMVRRFAFDLELLVHAHRLGYRIAEAPVSITSQREYGRIGLGTVLRMCLDTAAIYYRFVKVRAKRRIARTRGK